MKHLSIFYLLMLFFLTACGLCDPSSDNTQDNSKYVGTFKLTAWNAPVPVDIDQDGFCSRNLTTESMCYVPSRIVLSADHNYQKFDHYPDMESTSCGSTETSGIWTANGNTLKLVSSDGAEEIYGYGEVNNVLTRSESNWLYPTFDEGNGTYAHGDVNIVYTKE